MLCIILFWGQPVLNIHVPRVVFTLWLSMTFVQRAVALATAVLALFTRGSLAQATKLSDPTPLELTVFTQDRSQFVVPERGLAVGIEFLNHEIYGGIYAQAC